MQNLSLPDWAPKEWKLASDWYSPTWQIKNSIRSLDKLKEMGLKLPGSASQKPEFRMSITPHYLIKCYPWNSENYVKPLLLQVMPNEKESEEQITGLRDPLGEELHGASKGLVHRYKDRALWLITTPSCPIYCRYCTRKRITSLDDYVASKKHDQNAIDYLKARPEIRTVIISGGDPLLLSNKRLVEIVSKIREVDHIDHVRIGTRFLSVNPEKFSKEMLEALSGFFPLTFMVHVNHAAEIDKAMKDKVRLIRSFGFSIKNQAVLLKGVNDNFDAQLDLARRLSKIGIDPHYVFLCDPVTGSEHFWVDPLEAAMIYKRFLNEVDSLSRPRFVLDLPGGHGKVELTEENIILKGRNYFFKDKNSKLVAYPYLKDLSDLKTGSQ